MNATTNFVRGTVIQRSAVQRCAPPAHFVLCDPQTELTLLKLTLRAEDAAATGWRRARVWLWGVWCDRSAAAHRKSKSLPRHRASTTIDFDERSP